MTKIGKFRGYEVYRLTNEEWGDMDTRDLEQIFVVGRDVFFHDAKVGTIDTWNQLHNFDERYFMEVEHEAQRRKEAMQKIELNPGALTFTAENAQWNAEALAKAVLAAEMEVPRASQSAQGSVDPAAAVDSFMNGWRSFIDNEIADLLTKELDYETC
jgi:hypothetical protein